VSVSGISSNSVSSNDSATGAAAGRETKLGQDAFMRLLTTQLANQDPLKPQDNGEFIAQLAQFSSLEKLTSIETSIKELAAAFQTLAGTPPTSTDGTGTSTTAGTSTGTGN
jgi:flagellar basal-body rod modification protein FlgD